MAVKRQTNFELLRIVAMGMIIVLHYLDRGGILAPYRKDVSVLNYTAWLIEAFCMVSVNCYVLISGYFLAESEWKPGRVVSLAAQVLFYSLFIPIVLLCSGMIPRSELSLYDWLTFVFPFQNEHYWFATHYVILYLFAPVLAAGVQKLDRKTLRTVIALLIVFFSIAKTLIPFDLVMDADGYHYGWFFCLFLVGAYLRKYGIRKLDKGQNGAVLYAGMCILIWAISVFCGVMERRTGALSHYVNMPYTYNYFFVFIGSLGMFYWFKNMRIKEGEAAETIRRLAPYTFGIYLLHAHILVGGRWMYFLGIEKVRGTWLFIPHMIGCVLVVYTAGTVFDLVRVWIFTQAVKLWKSKQKGNRR